MTKDNVEGGIDGTKRKCSWVGWVGQMDRGAGWVRGKESDRETQRSVNLHRGEIEVALKGNSAKSI